MTETCSRMYRTLLGRDSEPKSTARTKPKNIAFDRFHFDPHEEEIRYVSVNVCVFFFLPFDTLLLPIVPFRIFRPYMAVVDFSFVISFAPLLALHQTGTHTHTHHMKRTRDSRERFSVRERVCLIYNLYFFSKSLVFVRVHV